MKETTENSAGPLSTNPNSQIDNETIPVPPSHESASCSASDRHNFHLGAEMLAFRQFRRPAHTTKNNCGRRTEIGCGNFATIQARPCKIDNLYRMWPGEICGQHSK